MVFIFTQNLLGVIRILKDLVESGQYGPCFLKTMVLLSNNGSFPFEHWTLLKLWFFGLKITVWVREYFSWLDYGSRLGLLDDWNFLRDYLRDLCRLDQYFRWIYLLGDNLWMSFFQIKIFIFKLIIKLVQETGLGFLPGFLGGFPGGLGFFLIPLTLYSIWLQENILRAGITGKFTSCLRSLFS